MEDIIEKQGRTENNPLRAQEKFEWYQINAFLQNMGQVAAELNVPNEALIHIGGTANFYRLHQAFGPVSIFHFRGTHDMDAISFRRGTLQQILERMKQDGAIASHSMRNAASLPDKKCVYVEFSSSNYPGLSNGFEVDLYESESSELRFNNRKMKRDRIIFDKPERLILPNHQGLAVVPSLRDNFLIKMDIVDYSRMGLRPKDQFDILVMLRICTVLKVDFKVLSEALLDDFRREGSRRSLKMKLTQLRKLFTNPPKFPNLPVDYPFFPSHTELTYAATSIQEAEQKTFGEIK